MTRRWEKLDRWATLAAVACALIVTGFVVRRELFVPVPASPRSGRSVAPVLVDNWDQVASRGRRLGPAEAPITIVEFADFECPFCARFAGEVWPAIRKAFPTEVSLLFRHWPLRNHRFAYPAARAAECAANQDRFEPFHDLLFTKRDSLGFKTFRQFAEESGVPDLEAFDRCNASTSEVEAISADVAEASRIGATGTPTVVVSGWRFVGTPDSARLDSAIRAQLARRR